MAVAKSISSSIEFCNVWLTVSCGDNVEFGIPFNTSTKTKDVALAVVLCDLFVRKGDVDLLAAHRVWFKGNWKMYKWSMWLWLLMVVWYLANEETCFWWGSDLPFYTCVMPIWRLQTLRIKDHNLALYDPLDRKTHNKSQLSVWGWLRTRKHLGARWCDGSLSIIQTLVPEMKTPEKFSSTLASHVYLGYAAFAWKAVTVSRPV